MTRRNFLEELFPPQYDFFSMLTIQADLTARGIAAFTAWLTDRQSIHYDDFLRLLAEADTVRMKLEEQLINAFTTPFDREDIYTFSVRMDRIFELARLALLAAKAYSVDGDKVVIMMAESLSTGTNELALGTALLKPNPKEAGEKINKMRSAHHVVQNIYRESLAELFLGNDPMTTIKLREIYHEIRETSNAFDLVVDVFHRIIVRLV